MSDGISESLLKVTIKISLEVPTKEEKNHVERDTLKFAEKGMILLEARMSLNCDHDAKGPIL